MTASGTGSAHVLTDLSESLHGVRTVAAHNRQPFNIVQHRNVVGDYQTANNYTAQINAIYGPGTSCSVTSPAPRCLRSREHGLEISSSIGALVAFSYT